MLFSELADIFQNFHFFLSLTTQKHEPNLFICQTTHQNIQPEKKMRGPVCMHFFAEKLPGTLNLPKKWILPLKKQTSSSRKA